MEKVELLVLKSLIFNEQFHRKVLPFIKKEYFDDLSQKIIFEEICNFSVKYKKIATKEIVSIEVENRSDITEDQYKQTIGV